jgi:hypothetical protein
LLQKVFGGCSQARLLAPVDTFCGRPIVDPSAKADFNEDQRVVMFHNEVDLTEPAAVVPGNERKTGALQVFRRMTFGRRAVVLPSKEARTAPFTSDRRSSGASHYESAPMLVAVAGARPDRDLGRWSHRHSVRNFRR